MSTPATTRVLMIGAGGHARVVLEALLDDVSVEVVGAVSHDGAGVDRLGTAVLGRDTDAAELAASEDINTFCVAIGNNTDRRRVGTMLAGRGGVLIPAISRSAVVSPTCALGSGVQLLPGAVVNAATVIGVGTIINTNASVDHDCLIGDYAHIAPGVAIGGDVTVGSGALVGIGARVLPGTTIGAGATVGGGAVVTRNVPDGVTVVGVPARPLSSAELET